MVRILNHMSVEEAENMGVPEDERLDYFRVDRAKGNMARRGGVTEWMRFVSVTLGRPELGNEEDVGVVETWSPTATGVAKEAAEHVAEHVFTELLVRFALSGRKASDKKGANYAPTLFAKEKEAKVAKVGKRALADAMQRLFEKGKIHSEQVDRSAQIVLEK